MNHTCVLEALRLSPGEACPLLDLVPDAVLVLDQRRRIVFANSAALGLLDCDSFADLMGDRVGDALDCIHANETAHGCGTTEWCAVCGAFNAVEQARFSGSGQMTCFIKRRGGGALDLLVIAHAVVWGGEPHTLLFILDKRDVTRRESLERTLANDLLTHAENLRNAVGLLRSGDLANQFLVQGLLWHMVEELHEDILEERDITRAERGELDVVVTSVSPATLSDHLAVRFLTHPLRDEKSLDIQGLSGPKSIRPFRTDETLLMRVLVNMIRNALEATKPKGTVTLLAEDLEDGTHFSVTNTGEMPRAVQLHIFQRSYSTHGSGRGKGTYAIKLITEKYLGGRVGFFVGRGQTVFEFTIPR